MPQFDNVAPSNLDIVLTSASEWIPTPGRAKARVPGLLNPYEVTEKSNFWDSRIIRSQLTREPSFLGNDAELPENPQVMKIAFSSDKKFRTDLLP